MQGPISFASLSRADAALCLDMAEYWTKTTLRVKYDEWHGDLWDASKAGRRSI